MVSETTVNNYNTNDIGEDSSYDDYSHADTTSYFKNISLRYFAAKPLEMLTKHSRLKELCLENGNPEAHYIEGLLQYFVHDDKHKGLYHIRQSANGNNKNSMYLYGLLMLARGHFFKGKKYLDKLEWWKKISTSDHCWESIKNSVSEIPITMKQLYYVNMVNLEPRGGCDRGDMTELCEDCYYYKRLYQFFKHFSDIA